MSICNSEMFIFRHCVRIVSLISVLHVYIYIYTFDFNIPLVLSCCKQCISSVYRYSGNKLPICLDTEIQRAPATEVF